MNGASPEPTAMEAVVRDVRHDLRNRLAAVRNAAVYLRRRSERTDLWQADARVPAFFALIEDELAAAERILTLRVTAQHLCSLPEASPLLPRKAA